jgi:uncharacterized protein (TIGR02246 family)
MKQIIFAAILLIAVSPFVFAQTSNQKTQSEQTLEDENAIRGILKNWDRGWNEFDAKLAAMDYADDADWLNAFGRKKKGRTELQKFLTELFVRPDMKTARFTTTSISIRFIKPNVALAYTDFEGIGQKTLSGKEMGKRIGHQIRVLIKENGKWIIVSHQIMDEREHLP